MEINASSKDSKDYKVTKIENDIYFTGVISLESAHILITNIKEVENNILKEIESTKKEIESIKNSYNKLLITLNYVPNAIKLYITSYGGGVHAAFSVVSTIEKCSIPVHTIISGNASSAATLISLAGHKRFMYKYSVALIHEIRCGYWGKLTEVRDHYLNNDTCMDLILNYYNLRTKLTKEQLQEHLKKDIDWTDQQCLEFGLIDEII